MDLEVGPAPDLIDRRRQRRLDHCSETENPNLGSRDRSSSPPVSCVEKGGKSTDSPFFLPLVAASLLLSSETLETAHRPCPMLLFSRRAAAAALQSGYPPVVAAEDEEGDWATVSVLKQRQ
ncbi:hypothetical protein MRB53_032263 [Persea americana]|uniref:Uncharacterized protein n=1 Tax=Persea americana TaxID=3435 RepID=A0ACC2KRM6_PERAE|nr:hypothetical protein MRB53_032263 [Persea americana]